MSKRPFEHAGSASDEEPAGSDSETTELHVQSNLRHLVRVTAKLTRELDEERAKRRRLEGAVLRLAEDVTELHEALEVADKHAHDAVMGIIACLFKAHERIEALRDAHDDVVEVVDELTERLCGQ